MTSKNEFCFRSSRSCFRRILATAFSAVAVMASFVPGSAQADQGLLSAALLGETEEKPFIDVKGWLSQGFTWNTKSSGNNGPVGFNDSGNEYQMNQLYLALDRSVAQEADEWDLGGRVDVMYGTDARFVRSVGFDDSITDRYYSLAIPQAYLETNIPVFDGVTFKAGHFYSPVGYERVTAPDNFFYSRSYARIYGEPITHWGGLFSKSFCDGQYNVYAGAVQGWDNLDDYTDHNLSFLGGFSSEIAEGTVLAGSVISGNEGVQLNRTLVNVWVSHEFTDKLKWVVQHDNGFQELAGGSNAQWFGFSNYVVYKLSDMLSTGVRGEWFRDDDGFAVANTSRSSVGSKGSYWGLSWGVNVNPVSYFTLRPEVRYDWKRSPKTEPFDRGTNNDQLLVAMDAIFKF